MSTPDVFDITEVPVLDEDALRDTSTSLLEVIHLDEDDDRWQEPGDRQSPYRELKFD